MAEVVANHVLAVDDEEGIRLLMTRVLESTGYAVRTAADAHDAMRSVSEQVPAVVLSDMQMPGPSGLWLAEQLRERSPATAVVLVTAEVPAGPDLPASVVGCVSKPIDPDEVRKAVAQAYVCWADRSGLPVPKLHPRRRRTAPPPAAL